MLRIDGCEKNIEVSELLDFLGLEHPSRFEDWFLSVSKSFPFIVKKGDSSFCEVFAFGRTEDSIELAVKIIPLLTSDSLPSKLPDPVPMRKALHEARTQHEINSLSKYRKYSIPSGYTGFNGARR